MENYLDQGIARDVLNVPGAADFGDFDKPDKAEWRWSKEKNWRIAREMSKADIEKTDLGPFLKQIANEVRGREAD